MDMSNLILSGVSSEMQTSRALTGIFQDIDKKSEVKTKYIPPSIHLPKHFGKKVTWKRSNVPVLFQDYSILST